MKKLGLIILAVVMMLGLVGAGYAYWQTTLTINGTAAAASWDVHFTGVAPQPVMPFNGTAVASASGNTGSIALTNIAPGYDTGAMLFNVLNAGSINATCTATVVVTAAGGGSVGDLNVTVSPSASTTLAPSASQNYSVDIQMNPALVAPAGVGATYTVTVTITAVQ
jgi:hypothetical protein